MFFDEVAKDLGAYPTERRDENRGDTPPFRTPGREIIPGSIAEIGYLNLGGLDQWVMIRGVSYTSITA